MMTKEGSTKIVNCMTHGVGGSCAGGWPYKSYSKMHDFKKNILYSQVYIRQTKYKEMMIKEGSNKIVNFMTSGTRVLVLECGNLIHIVKMQCVFENSFLYIQA